MGVWTRLAGRRALNLGRGIYQDAEGTLARMVLRSGGQCAITNGADVLIMECAGMGGYRDALQDALGLLCEPVPSRRAMAIVRIALTGREFTCLDETAKGVLHHAATPFCRMAR